ncbi:MAG: DUF452 family protein, partial [Muribaculaceae bacterium]|nr:DUF452 family protein [Muribaculaceae bacterium]
KRGAATRLILIFAGWSTDARYYNDCVAEGWDTAVVSDYRDISIPLLPEQYRTVYIFAYSLGVAAASICDIPAAVRIAICGSPYPVSDSYGIPEAIYAGTLDGLSEKSLRKFHLRMAGDRNTYEAIKDKLPEWPDINSLKEELAWIKDNAGKNGKEELKFRFDRVYLAEDDRIFPYSNLKAYWTGKPDTEIVSLKLPHSVDIASVVRDCIPDTKAIGDGFSRAGTTYSEHAVVQKEICEKIGEILEARIGAMGQKVKSLLEIGVGSGQLTEVWSRIVKPESVTYVDLTDMPVFDIAEKERYLEVDAEKWLEDTEEKFDIILSASTIQWFADPLGFVREVRNHLNPGGIAFISTFVKGNLYQLDAVRPSPIIYRTVEEYSRISGVETVEWERTLTFPSSRAMLMHLRLTGVSPRRKTTSAPLTNLPTRLTYRPLILFIHS